MDEIKYTERKEKIVSFVRSDAYVPMRMNELAVVLDVPSQDKESYRNLVNELIAEGRLIVTKKEKIMATEKMQMFPGTFIANKKGFGFVPVETGGPDIFIPAADTLGAMDQDQVLIRITKEANSTRRAEGAVVKILKRNLKQIVGTFEAVKNYGFVIPDDKRLQDVFIAERHTLHAVTGHKVVVKLSKYPMPGRNAEGKVVKILGHLHDPGVDVESVIYRFDLPVAFPEEVQKEVEQVSYDLTAEDLANRKDFRNQMTITIDGEDSKDLDDAISLEKTAKGYRLSVHIADVSHYVTEGSALDREARRRGTSVYFVGSVIPMLPAELSNGICSLHPEVDRLALSCVMELDHRGKVVGHNIYPTVICSNYRMTYNNVTKILDGDKGLSEEYREIVPMLHCMQELAALLNKKRKHRGSLDFDFPEAKMQIDEDGWPVDIYPYDRNIATNIIEEFMLVCNETVAEEYFWLDLPFLYRCHEKPDGEKIQKLSEFLHTFGYNIKGTGDLHPKSVQRVLDDIRGTEEETAVSRVVLRCMKQARYKETNDGHFGLAAQYYCHFTSPIRRYPDLFIHRMIKENVQSGMTVGRIEKLKGGLPALGIECSKRERTAEEAEREVLKMKKAQYMKDKIGMVYEGIISSVTSWGLYVELFNTIEGLVNVADMDDDYYVYDESAFQFVGHHTKKTYRLGDKVTVQVSQVHLQDGLVDFIFAQRNKEERR